MLILKLFILLLLLIIFIQDLFERAVYWVLFPLLAAGLLWLHILYGTGLHNIFEYSFISIAFITIQLVLVSAYFFLKQRRWINITAGLLGWGDIFFLYSITFFFSPLNFITFYISSLIVVLLSWMLSKRLFLVKDQNIPLAGLQALAMALLLASDWIYMHIDFNNDAWLINRFVK